MTSGKCDFSAAKQKEIVLLVQCPLFDVQKVKMIRFWKTRGIAYYRALILKYGWHTKPSILDVFHLKLCSETCEKL